MIFIKILNPEIIYSIHQSYTFMKTRVLFAFLLMVSISASFANNIGEVRKQVVQNFNKEYANATDIKWTVTNQFTKVTFKLEDQILFAYYNLDGERMAVSRNILAGQLPLALSEDIKKSYSSYWVTDMFEILDKDGTHYYATIEDSDQRIVLKGSSFAGSWSVHKRKSKS